MAAGRADRPIAERSGVGVEVGDDRREHIGGGIAAEDAVDVPVVRNEMALVKPSAVACESRYMAVALELRRVSMLPKTVARAA